MEPLLLKKKKKKAKEASQARDSHLYNGMDDFEAASAVLPISTSSRATGIQEKDLLQFMEASASVRPATAPTAFTAASAEITPEESLRRRRTLHELNVVFNSMGPLGKPRRRPVESDEARERRMQLLYDSVIAIFELQVRLEQQEGDGRRRRGDTPLSSAPSPPLRGKSRGGAISAAAAPASSFFRLPKMPSIFQK